MSLIGGWFLAPAVLMLLCGGAGLLADRLSGARLPGAAVPGVGLAVLVVVAGLLTIRDATAELATPACALVAVAGWAVGFRRVSWSKWPVITGVGAFALLAWPSVGSGQASVAGYIKLDDSAIWLGLIDHVMQHGRNTTGFPKSTFELDLGWIRNGYPLGAFTPVGVTGQLTGQAYGNVYQPVIAVYGALAALSIGALVRPLVGGPLRAALCALVAVQASLFVGYAQWGSFKEIAAAALLASLLAAGLRSGGGGVRGLLLAALPAAALLDTYGAGGIIWAGPAMVVLGVAVLVRRGLPVERRAAAVAAAVAIVALASVPAIVVLKTDVASTTSGSPASQEDKGNLAQPLELLQGAGLWLAGDFRQVPDPQWPSVVLAVLGCWLAIAAVVLAVSRRRWEVPVMAGVVLVGAVAGVVKGGPWIDAKVLAITSPFLLAAGAALLACAPRVLALAPVMAVALLSTWLIARDVYVAPRGVLTELRGLGRELAGKGPTLVLNYEGYGTRYLLADAQNEGISDLRYNQIPSRDGQLFPTRTTAEVDAVQQQALFSYPAIVRRRTPVGSLPPSGYRSVHAKRFFEAWRRDGTPLPREHMSLGTDLVPAAPLECRTARATARGARSLVAQPRVNPVLAPLERPGWPGGRPVRDGRADVAVTLPRAGVWRVWVGGGTLGRLRVSVDGRSVGSYHHQLDASIGWLRLDARRLAAGPHTVTLDYARGWRTGRGTAEGQLPLGPVALSLETQPAPVRLPASQVDRLCDGRLYDWLEAFE